MPHKLAIPPKSNAVTDTGNMDAVARSLPRAVPAFVNCTLESIAKLVVLLLADSSIVATMPKILAPIGIVKPKLLARKTSVAAVANLKPPWVEDVPSFEVMLPGAIQALPVTDTLDPVPAINT